MNKITFVFFSYNDSQRIGYVIRNVLPYGRVIVFDDHSTDNTKEVVEKFDIPFIVRPKTGKAYIETPETFEFVKQHVKTPWLYWGYTDNLLPRELLEKMAEVSEQDKYKCVHIPVYTYLWGDTKHVMSKGAYPMFYRPEFMDFSQNRLYGLGAFTGKSEEVLRLPDRPGFAMRHFSLYNLEKFINAHMRYAQNEVAEKMAAGKKFSVFYMLASMTRYFFIYYRNAFRAGVKGLYVSLLYANWRLLVSIKWYEEQHGLNLETIEADFAKEKERIVADVEARAKI